MNLTVVPQTLLFVYLSACAASIALVVAWQDETARDRLPDFLISWATLLMALIVISETALGIVGLLTVPALVILFTVAALASWVAFGRSGERLAIPPGWRTSWRRLHAASARAPLSLVLVLLIVLAGALTVTALAEPSTFWDSFAYHLPMPVDWLQSGAITPTYLPFGEIANSYFPGNAELLYFWVLAPFHGDLLVRLVPVGMWLLMGLGLWRVARQSGAGRKASTVAALILLFTPVALSESTELWVDLAQAALVMVVLGHLFEYSRRPTLRRAALFGLACGLLLGLKYSGPAFVILLLAAFGIVALSLRHSQSLSSLLRSVLIIALTVSVTGGYWYVFNLIDAGNPIYPIPVRLFGHKIFSGPGLTVGHTLLQFARDIRPSDMGMALLKSYGPVIFLAAAVAMAWAARGPRSRRGAAESQEARRQRLWLAMIGGLFVASLLLYIRTPYSVNRLAPSTPITSTVLSAGMRFSLIVGACGSVLIAVGLTRASVRSGMLWALALLAMVTGALAGSDNQYFDFFPSRIFTLSRLAATAILIVTVLLARPWLRRIRWPRLAGRDVRPLRAYVGALALPVIVILGLSLAGLDAYRERYRYAVYASTLAFSDVVPVWQWIGANIEGARIAYAGDTRVLGVYGRDFTNQVRYINVAGDLDQRFEDYRPSGTGYRSSPSYEAWTHNLAQWSAQYLVLGFPDIIEAKWAAEHPEIFSPILHMGRFRVYRINPELAASLSVP